MKIMAVNNMSQCYLKYLIFFLWKLQQINVIKIQIEALKCPKQAPIKHGIGNIWYGTYQSNANIYEPKIVPTIVNQNGK